MSFPFEYGQPVTQSSFINREDDILRLQRNTQGGINTILISPRRWGKSSLVQRVQHLNKDKKTLFCILDLFKVRTEEQFYQYFSNALIQATNTRLEETVSNVKKWLSTLQPTIRLGNGEGAEVELQLNTNGPKNNYGAVLDLPEKIARAKGIHLVVCLDEFQNISVFDDPLGFQKTARAHWQQHQHVTYILYGSKRHMMMELFERKSMPFYRFGDIFYLEKIATEHFVPFIEAGFNEHGRSISTGLAKHLAEAMKNHPYYVQQLAFILWNNVHLPISWITPQ